MTISLTPILDDAAVRVAVRARPLLEKEVVDNCQECVSYSAERSEVTVGKEKRFTFDHVFGPHVGQEEVYLACVKPLVDSCIAGYNATVLAYGQTGSGKTHTMGSANGNGLQEHELGILPRVIRQLYNSIEENNQSEFLVDLAGSERAKRTGAVGVRFKESITINSGLLALGNVISALGDERKRGQHVPYRQSKLTRILQDSLGGNSRTCMIACISLADVNQEETLNTLKYANRARNIHNKPIINRDSRALQMNQLRLQLKNLQEELITMRLRDKDDACALDCYRSRGDPSVDGSARVQDGASHKMPQDVASLTHDLRDFKLTIDKLNEQLAALQVEKDQYQEKIDEIAMEMNLLLRMIPSWEHSKEIAEPPILFLLAMAKRILTGTREGGMEFKACNLQMDIGIQILRDTQQKSESAHSLAFINKETPMNNDEILTDPGKENAFSGTRPLSTDTPRIIRHYLKTIQVLEKKLAKKEQELRDKNEALKEMNHDLARDERIFSEKMKEIKALKMLTRELTIEKDCLLQKAQMDATIISDLSHNALVKEGELSRLRASIEFQHMQPQDTIMTVDLDSLSDFKKKEQVGAMFTQGAEMHSWEDSFACNKGIEGFGATHKAENELDFLKEPRHANDETNQRPHSSFEKRFQDLAYTILKGGSLTQRGFRNRIEAMQKDQNLKDNPLQHKNEVPYNNTDDLNCGSWSKSNNNYKDSEWDKDSVVVEKVKDEMIPTNQASCQKRECETVITDLPSTMELEDRSAVEEVAHVNDKKCVEIVRKTFDCLEPKDMYLEKKLKEIALAWHAEKQAMEEMVQAERETWEARAMCAMRKQVQLERDHQALKEELENTRSLMQKAGLGIRLSAQNVRELSNGDVDLRTSISC